MNPTTFRWEARHSGVRGETYEQGLDGWSSKVPL